MRDAPIMRARGRWEQFLVDQTVDSLIRSQEVTPWTEWSLEKIPIASPQSEATHA